MSYRWYVLRLWIRDLPRRICWAIAFRLPPLIALYTFVRVSALSGDGPCECGYVKSYKLWVEKHKLDGV
jgi:hypothetical protein